MPSDHAGASIPDSAAPGVPVLDFGQATFIDVPTRAGSGGRVLNTRLDDQLWTAVKHDAIAAFAKKHPSTVAPATTP